MPPDSSTTVPETVPPPFGWAAAGTAMSIAPSARTHPVAGQRLIGSSLMAWGSAPRSRGGRPIPQPASDCQTWRRGELASEGRGRGQGGEQLAVDAAEAAVGEDDDAIALAQVAGQARHDVVDGGDEQGVLAAPAHGADEVGLGEPLALRDLPREVGGGHDHAVRSLEGAREVVLEDARARRVGARLEDGDEAPTGGGRAQRLQRLPHRRRMVREVVVDDHAPRLALHLQAPLDAAEAGQDLARPLRRHARLARDRDGGDGVADVVLPREREAVLAEVAATVAQAEAPAPTGGGRGLVTPPVGLRRAQGEGLHPAQGPRQDLA